MPTSSRYEQMSLNFDGPPLTDEERAREEIARMRVVWAKGMEALSRVISLDPAKYDSQMAANHVPPEVRKEAMRRLVTTKNAIAKYGDKARLGHLWDGVSSYNPERERAEAQALYDELRQRPLFAPA